MNLIGFADVTPDDPASVHEFLDMNALAHQTIHNALLEQGSVTPQWPLTYDTLDHDFLQLNAAECRAWASVLSLSLPANISTVDPEDGGAMRDWFNDYELFVRQVTASLNL